MLDPYFFQHLGSRIQNLVWDLVIRKLEESGLTETDNKVVIAREYFAVAQHRLRDRSNPMRLLHCVRNDTSCQIATPFGLAMTFFGFVWDLGIRIWDLNVEDVKGGSYVWTF